MENPKEKKKRKKKEILNLFVKYSKLVMELLVRNPKHVKYGYVSIIKLFN